MQQFILAVEGPGLENLEKIELPKAPVDGDAIETQLGTCVVIRTEPLPEDSQYAGRIVCRLP